MKERSNHQYRQRPHTIGLHGGAGGRQQNIRSILPAVVCQRDALTSGVP